MTGTIRRRCCGTRCSRAARRSWRALSGDSRRRAEGGVASPCWWASRGSGRRGRWRNLRDGAGAGGAGAVGAVLRGRGGAAVRAVRGGARGIRAGGGGRDAARRTRGEWAAARAAGAGASRAHTGPSRARRPSARRGAHAAHRRRHSVPARAGGADADGAGARRPHWADAGTVGCCGTWRASRRAGGSWWWGRTGTSRWDARTRWPTCSGCCRGRRLTISWR